MGGSICQEDRKNKYIAVNELLAGIARSSDCFRGGSFFVVLCSVLRLFLFFLAFMFIWVEEGYEQQLPYIRRRHGSIERTLMYTLPVLGYR